MQLRKLYKFILIVIFTLLIVGGGAVYYLNSGLETGEKLSIGSFDLATIKDGVYLGKYEAGRFSNKVKVKVKDSKIEQISLEEDVIFARTEITEKLFERVLKNQNISIDTISGATVTCKAYLKAIENALATK
jgi:uncharacterized protein with FMN-binding domain